MNRLALLLSLAALAAAPTVIAAPSLPVKPDVALALLPQTAPGLEHLGPWRMNISRARQEVDVDWLTTLAARRFEQTQPADGAQPASVEIELRDTGGYPLPLRMFGTDPAGAPRADRKVQTFAALTLGPGEVVILVNGRWLVRVIASGLDPKSFTSLLDALPLASLLAVKPTLIEKLPPEMKLTRIDELDPRGNSEGTFFFMTQQEKMVAEEAYSNLKTPDQPSENLRP